MLKQTLELKSPGLQVPSVGRIVHVIRDSPGHPQPNTEAAIITYVHEDGRVNLHVFQDCPGMCYMTLVSHGDGPGQWHWPPFVPPRIGEATHR